MPFENLWGLLGSSGASTAASAVPAYMSQDIGFGPGMIGPGAAQTVIPAGAKFSPSDIPLTSSGSNDIGFGSGNIAPGYSGYSGGRGLDWKAIAGGVGDMAKAVGKSSAAGAAAAAPMHMGGGGGGQTHAGNSNLLEQVVQGMMKRQQMYAAATDPQGAKPVEQRRASGILGF